MSCDHLPIFWSRRACVRHPWWRTKRSWPLFSPTFFFFFLLFSSSFFSTFYFSPTSGNLPRVKICFPQYFDIPRRHMQKKILFLGNFFFKEKKCDFRAFFWDGQRSVRKPGPTPSPWSILQNKDRYYGHLHTFRHYSPTNSSTLSTHIWDLKNQNIP